AVFAAAHFTSGFPNGVIGYLMVLIYGTMLGYLKERTNGIFAPYIAHVIADLTIGYFLYFYALQNLH
ncbi:CPBP family intramembrane metalloprotease, partial [candidate division KSB1 bacterium]|nr:CPBP family intramembrane metalloprotease [candidate division KSB1 bacterium]